MSKFSIKELVEKRIEEIEQRCIDIKKDRELTPYERGMYKRLLEINRALLEKSTSLTKG